MADGPGGGPPTARSFSPTPGGGIEPLTPGPTDSKALRVAVRALALLPRLPAPVTDRLFLSRQRSTRPPGKVAGGTPVVEAMAGGVPVTWLAPELASEGVLVFLHGGGYFAGPDRGQWAWVAEVQRRTGLAAVMVLYRMPPRHPFPAALDDALSAIGALCATDQIRDGRWILSGDSAGGGLALVATQARRDAGEPLPAGLLLTAPWVDVAMEHPDTVCPEREDLAVGRSILRWGAERYADGVPLDDPRLSPLNASMHGLPPVHLNVGTEDLFLADDRRLCAALEAAGVDVASIEQAGAGHVYPHRTTTPEAEWTIRSQVSWIRGHITPNDTITNEVAR